MQQPPGAGKRRRLLCFVLGAILLGLLAGCAAPTENLTSKELKIYAFSEYLPQELLAGFEKNTGVKVSLEAYGSNEELLAGLASHPGSYDLIFPSDYTVEILVRRKALRPLDLGDIPDYRNIDPSFLAPYFDPGGATRGRRAYASNNEKYTLPYMWGTTGIAYDTEKVTEPIRSWADLWRPELAGHLVVIDDARELMGVALLTLGYNKNEVRPKRLKEAKAKLLTLAPGVVAFDSAEPEKYLLSGEAWAGVMYNGNAARAAAKNPKIEYVFPEEGAGIWFDNMAIPKDAPHPDAALAFIRHVLRPENSVLITRSYPYSNPNSAAIEHLRTADPGLYDSYRASPITNPPADVLAGALLVKDVGEKTAPVYDAAWKDAKAAKMDATRPTAAP